jgi:surface antigen
MPGRWIVVRLAAVLSATTLACLGFAAPAQASDSYPYAHAQLGTLDRWGFDARECTSYAAWRLHHAGDQVFEDQMLTQVGQQVVFGNAAHWDTAARALGDVVSKTPAVGAIAQWNSYETSRYKNHTMTASAYGHVAYVVAVHRDGSVTVDQYNAMRPYAYSSARVRAPRYLYIGPADTG